MIRAFLSVLNVEKGEEKPVLLLLGHGFFMGIFLATYKSVAETLFLNNLGVYLKEALFISGGLGLLSTSIYAYIQSNISFNRLLVLSLITIFLFIATIRALFHYVDESPLIFVLFIMHGPIMSVLLLSFWGIFGRIFNLKQSKRIIGGIDSGQLLATILAFFSIPFINKLLNETTDLLIIGEIGLIASGAFMIVIVANYSLGTIGQRRMEVKEETKMGNLIKNKYVLYLALFLFFSMLAFTFVEFSFLSVAEQQYPDEDKLLNFLSVMNGSILVLSLLIQTFVNDKLINMYGLKVTLLVLPVVLTILTVLAIATGYLFGFTIASTSFIWFFLFISGSKLFTQSLREATENPVFKLFFMPLDSNVRFDIQTRVEGMVNEFSRLVAGGAIFLLGIFSFIELIHYSIILLAIIAAWFYLAIRIYNNYRVSIRTKLEKKRREAEEHEERGRELVLRLLLKQVESNTPERIIFALKMLSKISPQDFETQVYKLLNQQLRSFGSQSALEHLKEDESFVAFKNILFKNGLKEENTLRKRIENLEKKAEKLHEQELIDFLHSIGEDEKIKLAEYLGNIESDLSMKLLTELVADTNYSVKKSALTASGMIRRQEMLPFILDALQDDLLKDSAIDALISYGTEAFPNLESIFYSAELHEDLKLDVINIYGRVGGDEAIRLLWQKIDYPNYKVIAHSLRALGFCGFRANDDQILRIKTSLESDINNILWNLVAIQTLENDPQYDFDILIDALREENEANNNHIYMLLSMIFDETSIQLVKENIESRTSEGITYAIELLDVFLPEDIKQKIIPILDDMEDEERVKRLQVYFPLFEMTTEQIVKYVITRDYNQTNRWSKACAFYYVGMYPFKTSFEMLEIANLFNPDWLIKEMAAWALYQRSTDLYFEHINRLPKIEVQRLNSKILSRSESVDFQQSLVFYVIKFLKNKSNFSDLSGLFLSNVSDFIKEVYIEKGTVIEKEDRDDDSFFWVYNGGLQLRSTDQEVLQSFEIGDFIGEILAGESSEAADFYVVENTVLLQIDKNRFYELVSNDIDITFQIMRAMDVHNKKTLVES
jgi:AAA family ATP:ADP antiporter